MDTPSGTIDSTKRGTSKPFADLCRAKEGTWAFVKDVLPSLSFLVKAEKLTISSWQEYIEDNGHLHIVNYQRLQIHRKRLHALQLFKGISLDDVYNKIVQSFTENGSVIDDSQKGDVSSQTIESDRE